LKVNVVKVVENLGTLTCNLLMRAAMQLGQTLAEIMEKGTWYKKHWSKK